MQMEEYKIREPAKKDVRPVGLVLAVGFSCGNRSRLYMNSILNTSSSLCRIELTIAVFI